MLKDDGLAIQSFQLVIQGTGVRQRQAAGFKEWLCC